MGAPSLLTVLFNDFESVFFTNLIILIFVKSKFLNYFVIISLGKVALTDRPSLNEAPEIIKPLEAQIAETNSTVILEVEFTGVPQPEVQWFRNGKKIPPSQDIVTSETKTTLTIKKISRKSGGRYEVRVTNVAGEAKTSASVSVVGKYRTETFSNDIM